MSFRSPSTALISSGRSSPFHHTQGYGILNITADIGNDIGYSDHTALKGHGLYGAGEILRLKTLLVFVDNLIDLFGFIRGVLFLQEFSIMAEDPVQNLDGQIQSTAVILQFKKGSDTLGVMDKRPQPCSLHMLFR